jgi:hypothetical protein
VKTWSELQAECEDLITRHKVIQDATLDSINRLKLLLKETQQELESLEKRAAVCRERVKSEA